MPKSPYRAYATIMSTFVGGLAAAGALERALDRAPRSGRLLTWALAGAGINDWLQSGFTALTSTSNELEERVG